MKQLSTRVARLASFGSVGLVAALVDIGLFNIARSDVGSYVAKSLSTVVLPGTV
jgi:putative flippase GtrA